MMKKRSISTVMLLTGSALTANLLDDAFVNGKTEGYLRLGAQWHKHEKYTSDIALGGRLGFETEPVEGISAGAAFYTALGFGHRDNFAIPFFGNDNQNYSILGEAYLKGVWKETSVTLGRQPIDTPFADSDDIGMVPNLFEAYTLTTTALPDTTLMFSHITKWSGVDAPVVDRYTSINPGHGLQMLGAIYEGIKETTLSAWYYHADNMVDVLYLEGGYSGSYTLGGFAVGAQYARQDFSSNARADITGLTAEIGFERYGITLSAAWNQTDSAAEAIADNLFGGGPFFTSSEHLTLAEAGANGKALMGGISFDGGVVGRNGLTLSLNKLHLEGDGGIDADEVDTTLHYEAAPNLTFDLIYSDATDHQNHDNSFTNTRFFANYRF